MYFRSKIDKKINSLYEQIERLEEEKKNETSDFIEEKEREGWKEFRFESDYYGHHEERGDGDIDTIYLFHPSVDVKKWDGVSFNHGSGDNQDDTNDEFDSWLESINESQYYEVDMRE